MDLLDQMATFVRVVDSRSLSAAARAQRLSLAAVSRQLRALEADLGVTLIARTTRNLSVTDEGRRWYEQSVRILAQIEAAKSSVSDSRSVEGRLTISVGITIGSHFVTPVVSALLAKHSRLEIDLRLEDRIVDLVADGVDVALRGGIVPPDSSSVIARPMMRFERILVASPSYLRKHRAPKDPSELPRHCILVQSRASHEWHFHSTSTPTKGERSVRVHSRFECNAPLALHDAARADAGIASIADWLVADDIKAGRLVRVLADWSQAPTSVWALHRSDARGTPRIRAFLDALRQRMPQ